MVVHISNSHKLVCRRGLIWFPISYLLVEALERYHHFYGDALKVECPTGSGRGLGASHQTGWTALAARCIEDVARTKPARH